MTRMTSRTAQSISAVALGCGFLLTAHQAEALPRTHDGFYLQLDAGLGYLSSSVGSQGGT